MKSLSGGWRWAAVLVVGVIGLSEPEIKGYSGPEGFRAITASVRGSDDTKWAISISGRETKVGFRLEELGFQQVDSGTGGVGRELSVGLFK